MYTIACKFFDIFICIYPQYTYKILYIYICIHILMSIHSVQIYFGRVHIQQIFKYTHAHSNARVRSRAPTRDNFERQSLCSFPRRCVRIYVCASASGMQLSTSSFCLGCILCYLLTFLSTFSLLSLSNTKTWATVQPDRETETERSVSNPIPCVGGPTP